ncbi:MAG: hypothetical protein FJ272_06385, partial [Planctomycetes bacterium]|nr:hypothetical protein [Planctomycetota bacterium]
MRRTMNAQRRSCASFLLVAMFAVAADAATDLALWKELDIVPMPREVRLTGRELALDGALIVLGGSPSPQDEIGAEWINKRVARLSGAPLKIVKAGEARLRLIVGTRQSHPLIAAAGLKVGPDQPGERGYLIVPRRAGESTDVFLAGADPLGALYACVTLAELLAQRPAGIVMREASVTDWPDFIHMTLGGTHTGDLGPEMGALFSQVRNTAEPGSDLRAKYLAAMAELHDRLLGWKVSCVWYPFSLDNLKAISPAARALIKEGIEHGKARGVGALLYSMNPFAGRVAD